MQEYFNRVKGSHTLECGLKGKNMRHARFACQLAIEAPDFIPRLGLLIDIVFQRVPEKCVVCQGTLHERGNLVGLASP